jgi:YcxB-like protein
VRARGGLKVLPVTQSVVSLHFRYTEAEFVAATRLYMLRVRELRLRLATLFGMVTLGSFLLLMAAAPYMPALWFACGVILLALLYSTFYVAPRRAFGRDPRMKDDFDWQFSEQGIRQKTSHSEATFKWELFTRVIADRRFYLLGYGKHMFVPIPRRAFANPAQEAAFVGLLRRKITPDFNTSFLPADTTRALDTYTPPPTPPDWR